MAQYRLGVLGGMGPQATNTFYQFILDRTAARSDQEHVNALILSDVDMPDRTAAILGGEEEREAVYRRLLTDARLLENAGCTCIAVPCNTSHFFLDRVQEGVRVHILHMIRETARLLAARGLHRPGILFLDEPTSGIDVPARRAFWRRITGLAAQGTTVVITTHFMEEAEYCDRILIQDAGRVLELGSPDDVRARAGGAGSMEEAFIRIVKNSREGNAT